MLHQKRFKLLTDDSRMLVFAPPLDEPFSARERTDEWAKIKQWTLWPEQELYEAIRPLVLFHETAGERAKEIDVRKPHVGS
jgi:hypothetical protein